MSVACPNGHQSDTTDYCDQCGARIDGPADPFAPAAPVAGSAPAAPPAVSATLSPASPTTAASSPPAGSAAGPGAAPTTGGVGDGLCPLCQTPRIGEDRFCEGCGYDFSAPAPAPAAGSLDPVLAAVPGTTGTPAWEAVAVADQDYFDRVTPEGVTFPLHCPPRTFLLAGDQIRIGRRSSSRGIEPEVDLSGAPEDSAISHLHCILIEQPDGSYSVVDPGSTNGTTLNDGATPLTANVAVALADGDRVHLGAWTTITIRARRPAGAPATTP